MSSSWPSAQRICPIITALLKTSTEYESFLKLDIDSAEVEVLLWLTAASELVALDVLLVVPEVCHPIPPRTDVEPLSVVISGAATVTFVMAIPLAVYAHKQFGDCVGMKSPVVDEP